ncbi:NAD-dependent epimerase/dehydratase family protein [Lamprocystis purpurea]|jgi:nucleoside-diphosphate-sugar epimerase|uniref:NAD-dependent epimerase/dehydratase family protein n=1 Tax=Lamprocystis purpurea TaxID=61598 RepID=UPI000A05CE52|nr:NAD(P)-dependent oxidoreductase [Lamprocystis purpurea]
MKVIVTGGTGFIGKHTLVALGNAGHDVLALYRQGVPPVVPGVSWIRSTLDQPDWSGLESFIKESRGTLIHLAAHGVDPAKADWDSCFRWNVTHALRFWREAVSRGIRRIVTCGSCFEYGAAGNHYESIPSTVAPEPLDPYSASKAAATMALCGLTAFEKIQSLSLRPCIVFGEGEASNRLWPSLRRAALSGKDFPMTSGLQVRDFVPVEIVASALSEGIVRDDLPVGKLIIENIGSGHPQSVLEFATEWWAVWGGKGRLLAGVLPSRLTETPRLVPLITRDISPNDHYL